MNRASISPVIKRQNGRGFILAFILTELVAVIGALPGALSILFNIELDDAIKQNTAYTTLALSVLGFALTTLLGWRISKRLRKRLDQIASGSAVQDSNVELDAWREITSFTARFGISSAAIFFATVLLPVWIILNRQSQALSSVFLNPIASPNPYYFLFGGAAAILGQTVFCILLMERATLPFRLALVPADFKSQREGRAGALVASKFLLLILATILIGVLLIAPIGYKQAVRILFAEVSSIDVFQDLRNQTILFSALTLILGVGYSYYVSRSISNPIRGLIETFSKVEQGDLSARAAISAADELGLVAMHFNHMVERLEALQNTLEQKVAERTELLEASNEVGQVASSSLDPNGLLNRVINLFTDRFGYYFAAIYLLDPSEKWAEIRAATGEPGKLLIQNRQRHEVAGKSMVGGAIRDRSPKIAQIALQERERFDNPLLPRTQSEIALPLLVGERVLGALDVQSTKESDFGPDAIRTMQAMANHVAIALENARLFQEAQENLQEMRATQRQYLLSNWSEFVQSTENLEYGIGDESGVGEEQVEIPISLREQILGYIRLANPEEWTPEQENLVNAVADQAAVALENARLVNESRQTALRERTIASINAKIWSSATIDAILQTAAKELGRLLDASHATIELKIDEGG